MSTFPFCLLPRIHLLFLSICLLALLPVSMCGCFYVTAVRCFCFLWFEKVVSFVFPSFPQSTHCSACPDFGTKSWVPIQQLSLPIVLLVAMLFSSPIAISFFCAFRSNTESWHPSLISLSESSAKETSLSWSRSVSMLLPSCVSLSEFSWLSFLSQCRFSDFHVACHPLFLYFLLVCTIGRSIFRFVYGINLSCSFVKVHVPHA